MYRCTTTLGRNMKGSLKLTCTVCVPMLLQCQSRYLLWHHYISSALQRKWHLLPQADGASRAAASRCRHASADRQPMIAAGLWASDNPPRISLLTGLTSGQDHRWSLTAGLPQSQPLWLQSQPLWLTSHECTRSGVDLQRKFAGGGEYSEDDGRGPRKFIYSNVMVPSAGLYQPQSCAGRSPIVTGKFRH